MKFVTGGVFGNPEAGARSLLELAHSSEPVQDRRIYVEKINAPVLYQHKAHLKGGLNLAIERGWLVLHERRYLRMPYPGRQGSIRLIGTVPT